MLANRLGYKWVSTGAFYRGLAYVAMKEGVEPEDTATLVELAANSVWEVRMDDDQTRVFYKGQDVTIHILSEENGTRASKMSQNPEVRKALLENQRDCAKGVKGLVAEGRDCGTVVFPQALLKVFLTASQEERAARRAREQGLNLQETVDQQRARDHQDSNRAAAPMQVPNGARVVDSNGLQLVDVVDQIHGWVVSLLAESKA